MKNIYMKKGFTLIELVMVIVIMGILAATAVVKINDVIQAGRVTKSTADVNMIRKALMSYYGDNAAFPVEVAQGVDPGLAPDYIDAWPDETPWNGEYDYNYGTYAAFNYDGTAGNELYVSIDQGADALPSDIQAEVDNLLDDGATGAGNVRGSGASIDIYVAEGPNS
ncbi:MAG: type II secretion system protein [Candidatus Saelkia tenebricola]|nr:type II secretion system protein [Candidatus Saelkia tenebricola]